MHDRVDEDYGTSTPLDKIVREKITKLNKAIILEPPFTLESLYGTFENSTQYLDIGEKSLWDKLKHKGIPYPDLQSYVAIMRALGVIDQVQSFDDAINDERFLKKRFNSTNALSISDAIIGEAGMITNFVALTRHPGVIFALTHNRLDDEKPFYSGYIFILDELLVAAYSGVKKF